MNNFVLELLGTMFLVLLGDGVVANVVLRELKVITQDGLLLLLVGQWQLE